jgi:hypothetical protein
MRGRRAWRSVARAGRSVARAMACAPVGSAQVGAIQSARPTLREVAAEWRAANPPGMVITGTPIQRASQVVRPPV